MSGDLWRIWMVPTDATRPPALVFVGRFFDTGVHTLVAHAVGSKAGTVRDPPRDGRLVLSTRGGLFSMTPDWDETAGTVRLESWSAGDDRGVTALGRLEIRPGSSNDPARIVRVQHAAGPLFPPHTLSPAPEGLIGAIDRAAHGDAETFSWSRQIADHLPRHARLVTADDQTEGSPPPGAIWWPLAEGFAIVVAVPLAELALSRAPVAPLTTEALAELERAEPDLYRYRIAVRNGGEPWTIRSAINRIGDLDVAVVAPPWRDWSHAPATPEILQAIGVAPLD